MAIATYELDHLDVLRSDAYLAIAHENLSPWSKRVTGICDRLLRFEGEQIFPEEQDGADIGAEGLLVNVMDVDSEHEAEFNEWYESEHIPALSNVPGTLSARRFRAREGSPRYLALYHLRSPEVQVSEAWKEAASSPWTDKIRVHFRNHLRVVGRLYRRSAERRAMAASKLGDEATFALDFTGFFGARLRRIANSTVSAPSAPDRNFV